MKSLNAPILKNICEQLLLIYVASFTVKPLDCCRPLAQVLSCEFLKNFEKRFFLEHFWWLLLSVKCQSLVVRIQLSKTNIYSPMSGILCPESVISTPVSAFQNTEYRIQISVCNGSIQSSTIPLYH